MNEWGIPDWSQPAAYGETNQWSSNRWRWEFTRRRPDFRADFDACAEETYQSYVRYYATPEAIAIHGREVKVLRPDQPGFQGRTTVQQMTKYGIGLLNPRISEQPAHHIFFQPNILRTGMVEGEGEAFDNEAEFSVPEGAAAVRIDLDRPIAEQLAGCREYLEYLQIKRHGKKLQWRQHPKKWLSYLRVLDGRDAGATWRAIFDGVLRDQKIMNLNPEQEARGVWERGRDLMFNWRG